MSSNSNRARARAHYESAVKYEADGRLEKASAHLVRGMHYLGFGDRRRTDQRKKRKAKEAADAADAAEAERTSKAKEEAAEAERTSKAEAAEAAEATKAEHKAKEETTKSDPGTSDGDEWPRFPETMLQLARKLYNDGETVDSIILAIRGTGPQRVPSNAAVECWIRGWNNKNNNNNNNNNNNIIIVKKRKLNPEKTEKTEAPETNGHP